MKEVSRYGNFQAQVVEYMPALQAFSRRFYRNSADADDLVQETLLKALSNSHRFEEGTNLKSWLFTIMRNVFCTHFTRARREAPGIVECVADQQVLAPTQEWGLLAQDVERAYAALPIHYRDVLGAIVVDGLSYENVAANLNCAVGKVKSRLNRARHHLIQQFGRLNE